MDHRRRHLTSYPGGNPHGQRRDPLVGLTALPGESHILIQADVSWPETSQMVVEQAVQAFGKEDIVVNNAGAFRGEPEQPAYGASKAGLNAMSQSLAHKVAKHNIYIGVVAPGFVETDMAAQRLSGPE